MAKAIAAASPEDQPQWKAAPQRLVAFLKDTRAEMKKVVWLSWDQVQSNTVVVLICVFFFAAFFYAVDKVIGTAIEAMLRKMIGY